MSIVSVLNAVLRKLTAPERKSCNHLQMLLFEYEVDFKFDVVVCTVPHERKRTCRAKRVFERHWTAPLFINMLVLSDLRFRHTLLFVDVNPRSHGKNLA